MGATRPPSVAAVPVILTGLFCYLFMLLGTLLFVVPGILVLIRYAFVASIVMVENKASLAAMARSRVLVANGYWKPILALFAANYAFDRLCRWALGLLLASLLHLHLEAALTRSLLSLLATLLVDPLFTVAYILLYFDSRIRKEGYDLEVLAQEMGAPMPAAAPSAPSEVADA